MAVRPFQKSHDEIMRRGLKAFNNCNALVPCISFTNLTAKNITNAKSIINATILKGFCGSAFKYSVRYTMSICVPLLFIICYLQANVYFNK